jgi:hypothetical protein
MRESSGTHRKIGGTHMSGMARLGLREIRAMTYAESNIAQETEYGIYGTQTPGEIADSRRQELEKEIDIERE